MRTLYPDAGEYVPSNAPESLGKIVQINDFVDTDLEWELTTCRQQTGILIFLNISPTIWYSKQHHNVEARTYGLEFVTMQILVKILLGLCYKLCTFEVPLDGPYNVFYDNDDVACTTILAENTLKEKDLSIAYYKAREAVACGAMLVFFKRSGSNLSDCLTKVLVPQMHHGVYLR